MKICVARKIEEFAFGFTLQKGFIFGFIERGKPFATNGKLFCHKGKYGYWVYEWNTEFFEWKQRFVNEDEKLFKNIHKVALKRQPEVYYANDLEINIALNPDRLNPPVSKPYDGKFKDSKHWCAVKARKEVAQGLGAY